jgi:hypothetical protein
VVRKLTQQIMVRSSPMSLGMVVRLST